MLRELEKYERHATGRLNSPTLLKGLFASAVLNIGVAKIKVNRHSGGASQVELYATRTGGSDSAKHHVE